MDAGKVTSESWFGEKLTMTDQNLRIGRIVVKLSQREPARCAGQRPATART